MATTNIAADGDIILVIGGEKGRCCVQSFILRMSSDVFKAMLSSHYSEGGRLETSTGSPIEIDLPDDSYDAMAIVLRVLHLQDKDIQGMTASTLLEVAVLVDKYQCQPGLAYAASHWLRLTKNLSSQDLFDMLAASYLLDCPNSFQELSHELVFNQLAPFDEMLDVKYQRLIPSSLPCTVLTCSS